MTVEIRQAGDLWSVEVRGASIGVAQSQAEARKLADYWQARLESVAHRRSRARGQSRLSTWLARLHNVSA